MSNSKIFQEKQALEHQLLNIQVKIRNFQKRAEETKEKLRKLSDKLMEICDHDWKYVRTGDPCGPTLFKCYECGNFK